MTWANLFDGGDDPADGGGLTDDAFKAVSSTEFVAQAGILMAKHHGFRSAIYEIAEDDEIEGFFDKVVGPAMQCGFGSGDIAVGRDHYGGGFRLVLFGQSQDIQAGGFALHDQIGHDDIEGAMKEFIFGFFQGVNDGANVAGFAKGFSHDLGVIDFIIDDENLGVESSVWEVFGHWGGL